MPFSISQVTAWPRIIPDATRCSDGLMTAADKIKLDTVAANILYVDRFDATWGQTKFNLSAIPMSGALFSVNGQLQELGTDFSVVGQTAIWTNNDFLLVPGDVIQISYIA